MHERFRKYFFQFGANRAKAIVIVVFLWGLPFGSKSQTEIQPDAVDMELLNELIINEVNRYRKKAKVNPVHNEPALLPAADDHANYMLAKRKLTHNQRQKAKRSPLNRVEFYGSQFDRVGENVQQTYLQLVSSADDKKDENINTYEELAVSLVLAWRNSPPHYENMIRPEFETTYTAVAVGSEGEVYACQLFGGSIYKDVYAEERDTSIRFKPFKRSKCWRCRVRPPAGRIEVTADSLIVFEHLARRRFLGIVLPSFRSSRMRFFNPWRDGLAADIVLKPQYTCDSSNYFNGIPNFRGIPLAPVYKKDYMGIPIGRTQIVLGKVPSYIKEEFEVNLVVIQNNRACSNTMFYVIPSDFHVEIPVNFDFWPDSAIMNCFKMDTLSKRIYFDKSMISPKDSVLNEIVEWLNQYKGQLKKITIAGYASIEGSTETNSALYKNRTDFLLRHLDSLGIDSTLITTTSAENFADFRRDIIGTDYEYLNALSDLELKEKLTDQTLSAALEPILSKHRYVQFTAITRFDYKLDYDADIANEKFSTSIEKGSLQVSERLQRIQYGLALNGKMTTEEIEAVDIPFEKKNRNLLHNRALTRFLLDTMDVSTLKTLRNELSAIQALKKNDERINTSIAIIDYHLYTYGEYSYGKYNFYDTIRKRKFLDEEIRARILLNVASSEDWGLWRSTGKMVHKAYRYTKVKPYVSKANLDVDKTFEIATYYSFFDFHRYAYDLIKGKIDETKDPNDLIFFLKLVHLTDIKLSRAVYLNCFKRIRKYSGKEFCTFFNNPALNFQILDDPEIKEIYCEECGED